MTVKELIEILSDADPDSEVYFVKSDPHDIDYIYENINNISTPTNNHLFLHPKLG